MGGRGIVAKLVCNYNQNCEGHMGERDIVAKLVCNYNQNC